MVKIPARPVDSRVMSVAAARQPPYPVRLQQRRCGKCGKLVSRAAYACRRCGKSQRLRPKTILLMVSGVLMVGMFVAAAISGSGVSRSADAAPVPATSPVAAQASSPVQRAAGARAPELSAAELWSTYSRDRAAADRLYRDRSVVVSGVVRAVDRNYEGDMVVRLATPDAFDAVNATLATRNDPALVGLAKGRTVSLLCVGRGALMGAPQLGSCFVK
jgi:ribosomal protein L40E